MQYPLWIPYFFVTLLMTLLAQGVPIMNEDYNGRCDIYRRRGLGGICVTLVFLTLVLFCAFKRVNGIAIDEYAYRNRFTFYSTLTLSEVFGVCEGEYINGLLVWLSTRFFHTTQGIFIVFGTLTSFFYLKTIQKYSRDYAFAVTLLMCMGIINTSLNVTQQALACAVFVCFCDTLYERKPFKFAILVLCCYMIHKSSIILVVFFLLASPKNRPAKVHWYYISFGLIIAILYKNVSLLASSFSLLERYSGIEETGHSGIRMITIIIECVPAVLVYLYQRQFDEDDRITILAANITIMHAGIYIAGSLDRFIGRVGMFTAPFVVLFLSRSTNLFSNRESEKLYKVMAVLLYAVVLYLSITDRGYVFNLTF